MIKVRIGIEDTSFWGVDSELMWASQSDLGFVLENSPTYAYGFSYKDTVSAIIINGEWVVTGVVARGGHSTYRAILREDFDESKWLRYWMPLQKAGCSYESDMLRRVYSIDVSPGSDINSVFECLEGGEESGFWDFEEGHCGHAI